MVQSSEGHDLLKCSFINWYDTFKEHTFKSIALTIPQDFISYLQSDGIILPKSSMQSEVSSISNDFFAVNFENDIKDAINTLGGKIFPKLNWSSPKDASFMRFEGMKCKTPADIYLLLKSSSFINFDLNQEGSKTLVLRRWCNMNPKYEFRCFIRRNKLIGISQRALNECFFYSEGTKMEFLMDICHFISETLMPLLCLQNVALDIYLSQADAKPYLVDLNPYGNDCTDPLLFSWEELNDIEVEGENVEFRVIEDFSHCRTDASITMNRFPIELSEMLMKGNDLQSCLSSMNL